MAGPSMMLPGGPLEICFSFDTTVSMTSYVDQVKARLQDMVQKLKSDIPGIKIALFAHGDYYQPSFDNKSPYVTRNIDFSDNVPKLCKFIKDAIPTNGGDWDECYELVMKEAREKLKWSQGSNRVLVMLGDAHPHPPKDYDTEDDFKDQEKLDWKEEIKKLLNSKIRSYGVYCNTPRSAARDKKFFKTLSDMGQGSFLELKNFDSIFDFMMAICYREHGEDALFAYEAEVRGRSGGAAKDVHHMLTTLKKSVSNASTMSTEGLNKTVAKPAKPATKVISKTKGKRAVQTGKKAIAPSASRGTAMKTKKATGRGVITALSGRGNSKAQGALGRRGKQKQIHAQQPQTKKKKKTTVSTKPATITGDKTNKARKHGAERLAQFKSKTLAVKRQKLRRERVPETNFALRDFPWSPWKIIASSEARKKIHPIYGAVGLKNRILEYTHSCAKFKGETKQPVLYEFAVKPLGHRQKKIVYAKICPKNVSYSTHWRDILNSSKSLKKQIENIIRKQGGVIYFRRLVLKRYKRYENIPSIIENYDYVWAPETGAKKYRELIKDSYVISEDMDVD